MQSVASTLYNNITMQAEQQLLNQSLKVQKLVTAWAVRADESLSLKSFTLRDGLLLKREQLSRLLKKAHCNLLFHLKTWYSHSLFSIWGIYTSVDATAMLSDEHSRTRPQCGNRWIIQYFRVLSLYKLPAPSLQQTAPGNKFSYLQHPSNQGIHVVLL